MRGTLLGAGAAASAGLLIWARPAAAAADRPDLVVAAGAAYLAWACLLWLCAGVLLALAARLPGWAGRVAGVLANRAVPALVRRLVAGAVGVGVATGVLAAPALAEPPRVPPVLGPAGPFDRPVAPASPPPVAPPTPAPPDRPATPPRATTGGDVVVAPGDTLWGIAARALGPGAPDAAVDAEWRRWYAANRAVVGPDPDLIHPGQRLRAPAS